MKQPWWMRRTERLRGRRYQLTMRAIHRIGWCYPQSTAIRPGAVWCHWCGMRGQKPVTLSDLTGQRGSVFAPLSDSSAASGADR
jgi:hypothetical protein